MEHERKPPRKRPLQRSEQPLVGDGQLGGEAIERQGAEERNPEGSVDISNEDLRDDRADRAAPARPRD